MPRDTLRTLLDHRIISRDQRERRRDYRREIKVGTTTTSPPAPPLSRRDADLLILLTDQKGLFTADPRTNPDAQLIEEVQTIDDTLRSLAGDSVSGLRHRRHGHQLQVADVAPPRQWIVVIATGQIPEVIESPRRRGGWATLFPALALAAGRAQSWILAGRPHGEVQVDQGRGRHAGEGLQPAAQGHTVAVKGDFVRGDVVRILDPRGEAGPRHLPLRSSGA